MSAPEVAEAPASASPPLRVRPSRRAGRSGRAGRAILEKSGLPRPEPGRPLTRDEARAWGGYLAPLADRLGLRPVPKWAVADLRRAGLAHLTAERLYRLLAEETRPTEQRRLRSEIRRSVSQARTAERVLSKLVEEQRRTIGPTSLRVLARG